MTSFDTLWHDRYGPSAKPVHAPDQAAALMAQMLSHRTVRAYLDTPVSESAIELMMAAAQSAATSSNLQTWSVVAVQDPQLGTGHAVDMARPLFERGALGEETLVLCGDGPLIRPHTLQVLLDTHRSSGASATLATAVIPDPQGYGRIQRDSHGNFARIVEQKDATPAQLAINEVYPSYYCFRTADLFDALTRVTNQNASGEYYITDVFELLLRDGKRVSVVDAVPAEDVLSVNTPEQLAEVSRILEGRSAPATGARA